MKKILIAVLLLTGSASFVLAQKRQTQVAIDDGSGKYGVIKTGTLTGNHTYTLPDVDGTLLLSVVGGYLPLSGGTMTGALNMGAFSITGALIGNASTATKLATARNINGVAFDGSADITVTAAAGTLTGATLASNVLASSLTSVGTLANLTVTNPIAGSVTGSAASFTGSLSGDVSGTQGATSVDKLKGNTVPADAAGVLTNNGTGTLSWVAPTSVQTIAGVTVNTTLTTNATNYWFPGGGAQDATSATVSNFNVMYMPHACTIRNLYVSLSGTAGSGNSYAIAVYNVSNSMAGPSVTISGSSQTSGLDLSTTLSVSAGQFIAIRVIPTSNPTARQAAWGFEVNY